MIKMVRFDRTVVIKTLHNAILDLNEVEVKQILNEKLANGENPQRIVKELRQGVNLLTNKFKEKVVGIVELGMASYILRECLESIRGLYEGIAIESLGQGITGTIQNNREDISHNLLATLLFGAGFNIFDLGDNILPELLIKKTKELSPDFVVISGLNEDSVDMMMETTNSFIKSGITSRLIVGPKIGMSYIFTIDEDLRKIIQADAFISDIVDVGDLAKELMKGEI